MANNISPIERLEEIENNIQKAKLEAEVYDKQLKEDLLPKRTKMEEESLEKYACSIDELPNYKAKLETELEKLVDELESEIAKARTED